MRPRWMKLGTAGSVAVLLGLTVSARAAELRFKKHHIDKTFLSEGVAIGDVNHDGKLDIMAGPVWYEAPSFTERHEIRKPGQYDGTKGYSHSFMNVALDVNHDGWIDQIIVDFPGDPVRWYENPQNSAGPWKVHPVAPSGCNETPLFTDLTGDGIKEMVFAFTTPGDPKPLGRMAWFEPPSSAGGSWTTHPISKDKSVGTFKYSHGLGVGDINGDGRNDVIIVDGWWEGPHDRTQGNWTFHEAPFGPAAADMYAYDVDADGDNDVISSSAHSYGIWWYEQSRGSDGRVSWKQHLIQKEFSQTHALHLVDLNGDGLKDLVTGKRWYAHQGKDPGGKEPAVLYWFELQRRNGKPTWTRHLIDDDSGIGTQFIVDDLNGDGRLDIIVSNKKGTFFHEQLE